jgi:probable HAF family extracellular repeat protein
MTCQPRTLLKAAWTLVALLAPIAANAQTTVKYHVIKLAEVPAPSGCVPTAINDNGDVVGYCNAGGLDSFGVLWSGGAVTDLGRLAGGTFSHAWGINSHGQIVGDGNDTANNLDPKAVILGAAGWVGIDGSGGSAQAAYGLTDAGVVFGNFTTQRHPGTETWDPVYWTYDVAHDRYDRNNLPKPLGTLVSGAFIFAATKLGIAAGQVASDLVGNQGGLWTNDPSHTLVVLDPPVGFASGAAFAVSDDARAVGFVSNPDGTHAALWQNDANHTPVDLGTLAGDPDATAFGVNTAGQVVGASVGPTSPQGRIERAFILQNGGLVELSSMVDPADGAWTINRALGINNAGQIIAVGAQNGQMSPVLLLPVTITCAPISIAAASLTATFGEPVSTQLSASGGTAPYAFTIVSGTLPAGLSLSSEGALSGTATVAGDFTVTVSATDAAQCASATASVTVHVAKAAQTIAFAALASRTFGDPAFVVGAAGGASGQPVTFSATGACSITGDSVSILGAGSCSVTASQAGDDNYLAAADVPQSFTIDKASQTIAFGPLANRTYGDAAFAVSASGGASGNAVTLGAAGACSVAVNMVTIAGAGSCTITASQAGSANYLAAGDVPQSFTIAKGSSVVTWGAPASITYGTALGAAQLNATATVPGAFVYSPAAGDVLGAGNHTLTVTFTATDANFTGSSASVQLHVNQAAPAITWSKPADITFGTPLGAAQLAAAADVPGSFSYTPSAGTVLPVGAGQTLSAAFTPADTANYTTATASVLVNVVAIQPPPADNILAPVPDQQNAEGDRVEIQLEAAGVTRRDKVAYTAANLPPGLDIDKDKGVIKGRNKRGSAGQYHVTVTLFANRTSYTRSFVWTVTN